MQLLHNKKHKIFFWYQEYIRGRKVWYNNLISSSIRMLMIRLLLHFSTSLNREYHPT